MQEKYSNYLSHGSNQNGHSHNDDNHSNIDGNHHHHHRHDHAHGRDANSKVLAFCLIVTFSFALIEGVGGYFTHSITLQSDALHMLTDAAGLLIAFIANTISKRPATTSLTFGYGKAEALGALVNCVFTMVLTLGLLFEVIKRFFISTTVHGEGLFIIAGIGFLVNGLIAYILAKSSESLNTKAALIHTLGDLLASVVAIIAGVIIIYTGYSIVDPILSLIVVFILIVSNYKLIKKSAIVLMAGVPDCVNYEDVGRDLELVGGVVGVHDLHIWYISANTTSLSAHIIANNPLNWQDTLLACQTMLKTKYKISHVTLQYEFNHNHGTGYCDAK